MGTDLILRRCFRTSPLDVAKGSQLAIVGSSGSESKSTLLGLILGLLTPSEGSVTIDGQSPQDYFADPAVRIGYVGAEAFLLAGTIRDNLLYGSRATYTDTELLAALEQASLRSAVKSATGSWTISSRKRVQDSLRDRSSAYVWPARCSPSHIF